jgi:DNA-binding NtrC family response regulator
MRMSPVLASAGGVLVASPSLWLREQVRHSLGEQNPPVQEATGGADALLHLASGTCQMLYLDRQLRDLDTAELILIIKQRFPEIAVVMLDSESATPIPGITPERTASGAIACGSTTTRAMSTWASKGGAPSEEEAAVQGDPSTRSRAKVEALPGMIGSSEPMQRLYQLARLVATRSTTILITGATGTGKELVARALHQLSPRAQRPFMVVNCAAIPEALLESELFGYVRGAFTGAVQAFAGRIQAAQHGTLFLDEVGDLPLGMQAKLLRFLDQKEVQRLGSTDTLRVDVRIVAATNADLEQRVRARQFREDLYYRLSTFPLEVPSLAERIGDIEALSQHFLRQALVSNSVSSPIPQLAPKMLRLLEEHDWAGNVRELQQVMERTAILLQGDREIRAEHLCFSRFGFSRLSPPGLRGSGFAPAGPPRSGLFGSGFPRPDSPCADLSPAGSSRTARDWADVAEAV